MSNKDWTDRLPELLENFTEAEPAGLWDAVRGGIVPARRRVAAGWWYAGGALLAAAAVVAVVLLWPVRPSADVSVVPGNTLLGQGSSLTEAEEALASSARLASQTPPSGAGSLPLQPRGAMAARGTAPWPTVMPDLIPPAVMPDLIGHLARARGCTEGENPWR